MPVILLPKNLDFLNLQKAVGGLRPDDNQNVLSFDFSRVGWVQPSGMAGLAALIRLKQKTMKVQEVNVKASKAYRYFQDMDFFDNLGITLEEDLNANRKTVLLQE